MNAEIPDKVIAYNIYTNGVKLSYRKSGHA